MRQVAQIVNRAGFAGDDVVRDASFGLGHDACRRRQQRMADVAAVRLPHFGQMDHFSQRAQGGDTVPRRAGMRLFAMERDAHIHQALFGDFDFFQMARNVGNKRHVGLHAAFLQEPVQPLVRTVFLVGDGADHQRSFEFAFDSLQVIRRGQQSSERTFVIGRAASPDVAILNNAAQWRNAPAFAHGHNVGVRRDEQARALAGADFGDQAGPVFAGVVSLKGNTARRAEFPDVIGGDLFVARRVDRVELDQFAEQRGDQFAALLGCVDNGLAVNRHGNSFMLESGMCEA